MNGNMYFCVLFFLHFLLWHDINQKIARSVCPFFYLFYLFTFLSSSNRIHIFMYASFLNCLNAVLF